LNLGAPVDLGESEPFTDDDGEIFGSAADGIEGLLADFITRFVTKPDLERGFKWSGKTQSHVHLENVNHSLRRRLAGMLLSVERSRVGLGGLLDNDHVHEHVLDRLNNLGQRADNLCTECAATKRGTADLTMRTEHLQHSVTMLHNWIDWLRMPTIPAGGSRSATPPVAKKASAQAGAGGGKVGRVPSSSTWGRNDTALGQLAATLREKARQDAEAADRAMQDLLKGTCLLRPIACWFVCFSLIELS
jgi:hypothetical protein